MAAVCSVVFGCADGAGVPDTSRERAAVVYGADDRREIDDVPAWRQVFDESVVALIRGARLVDEGGGQIGIRAMTLSEKFSVCDDERFALQVTAASCGGVLIGSDLVLTAGHCFSAEARCDRFAYVMGYAGENPKLDAERVYGCRDVIVTQYDVGDGRHVDFAVVKLDRPVRGAPVSIDRNAPRVGDAVTMLGFPNGLPGKVDTGGTVTEDGASDHFQATLDAFAGNSGSPVFDEAKALRGILVAGAPYDYVAGDGCWRVREVPAHEIADKGTERIALPGPAREALGELGETAIPAVRCTGLDCTADDVAEIQTLPPPTPADPPDHVVSFEKTAPVARGCAMAASTREHGPVALVALVALTAWRRRIRRRYAPSLQT
jgi:MYXO-CTERM domain-containing protein